MLEIVIVLIVIAWGASVAYDVSLKEKLSAQFNQAVTASEFCAAATATQATLHAEAKPEDVAQCDDANRLRNAYRKSVGY